MKIIRLHSENIKNLRAVEISPEGKPIILTGDNGAGKSSVLDSIELALTNKGLQTPVRKGAKRGLVEIDLGNGKATLKVKRSVTAKGSYLTVTNEDGKVSSPQALLDSIVGNLAIDPHGFTRLKEREQREMLMQTIGVDFREVDVEIGSLAIDRAAAKRALDASKAKLDGLDPPEDNVPDEAPSIVALYNEKDALAAQDNANEEDLRVVEAARGEVREAKELVAQYKGAIKELEARLEAEKKALAGQQERVKEMIENGKKLAANVRPPADKERQEVVESNIKTAYDTIQAVDAKKAYLAAKEAVSKDTEAWEWLERAIKAQREHKDEMLQSAKLPVEGLSVDEDGVLYKDVRFSQLSTAEQIHISTRIAMALNPELKIIFIREGALISKRIWKDIAKAADEGGYQVWVEKFQEEAGKVGLHIEDGVVVAKDGEEVKDA